MTTTRLEIRRRTPSGYAIIDTMSPYEWWDGSAWNPCGSVERALHVAGWEARELVVSGQAERVEILLPDGAAPDVWDRARLDANDAEFRRRNARD